MFIITAAAFVAYVIIYFNQNIYSCLSQHSRLQIATNFFFRKRCLVKEREVWSFYKIVPCSPVLIFTGWIQIRCQKQTILYLRRLRTEKTMLIPTHEVQIQTLRRILHVLRLNEAAIGYRLFCLKVRHLVEHFRTVFCNFSSIPWSSATLLMLTAYLRILSPPVLKSNQNYFVILVIEFRRRCKGRNS